VRIISDVVSNSDEGWLSLHTYVRKSPGEGFNSESLNLRVKRPLKIMGVGCRRSGKSENRPRNGQRVQVHQHNAEVHGAISCSSISSFFRMTMCCIVVPNWSPAGSVRIVTVTVD